MMSGGCLNHSDHAVAELKTLGDTEKTGSRATAMGCRRAGCSRNWAGMGKGPPLVVGFEEPSLQSVGTGNSSVLEAKQAGRRQPAEEGTPPGTQAEKQSMKAWKQGQDIQKDYRGALCLHRKKLTWPKLRTEAVMDS